MQGAHVVILEDDRETAGIVGGQRFNLQTGQYEIAVHTTSFIHFVRPDQVRAA